MSKDVIFVVPSFKGPDRVDFLLRTVARYDPPVLRHSWFVFEDPCGDDSITDRYRHVCAEHGKNGHVNFVKLDTWSNMHGAARKAFDFALLLNPEWIVYLGDDLAVTPGSLSVLTDFLTHNELTTVGLVQPSYWNAHDLTETLESEWDGPKLFWRKEDFYRKGLDWVADVPENPHWRCDDPLFPHHAFPYVNVNGVGFACRAQHYRDIGGFAEGTWCLDESISVRTWLRSEKSIVALPGPPLVHYFGASSLVKPPKHDMHTEARWEAAMGMTKEEAGKKSYERMFARAAAVRSEMKRAWYARG